MANSPTPNPGGSVIPRAPERSGGEALRVVHVGPHIDSFGGTQTVIRVLRDHRVGVDAAALLPTWDGSSQLHNARLTARAARAIAHADPGQIFHFHISNGGGWLREGPLIVLAKRRGCRVVVTIHGFDFPEFTAAHPRFVAGVLSRANWVLCLSAEARDAALSVLTGAGTQVGTITNPVAIDWDAPAAGSVPPVVLFAGSVGVRKGVDVLVDAWRIISAQVPDATCRIVGPIVDFTPPELPGLSLEPAVAQADVRPLLHEARVVVLPSRAEAMPMVLTEALANGRPFVATDVGGIASITPDPAMIVPVGDPEALAAALLRYLRDVDEADRAGTAGRDFIASTRSTEVVGAQLRAIYRDEDSR